MTDVVTMQPRSTLAPRAALAIGGCVLFIIAKSMATGGQVTIEQPLYWFVGLVPFAVWIAPALVKSFATGRSSAFENVFPPKGRLTLLDFAFDHSMVWLLALTVYVVVHEFHLASLIQTPIYEAMHYQNFTLTNLILSCLYVGIGFFFWTALSALRSRSMTGAFYWAFEISFSLVFNVFLFFALVYCIPVI